jgi:hypothetical protein
MGSADANFRETRVLWQFDWTLPNFRLLRYRRTQSDLSFLIDCCAPERRFNGVKGASAEAP